MKKRTLLSALLVIALCFSIVVGSSFALLTTESEYNVSISSASVSMTATVDSVKLYSVAVAGEGAQNTVTDEFGNKYVYQEQATKFFNGGTALYESGALTLSNITPGDKVEFKVGGTNTGDIALKSRLLISCTSGEELMEGLVITINGASFTASSSYASDWATVGVGAELEELVVSIELPVSVNSDYQGLSSAILITVEAIQANGTK